jgi:hypothetical protein
MVHGQSTWIKPVDPQQSAEGEDDGDGDGEGNTGLGSAATAPTPAPALVAAADPDWEEEYSEEFKRTYWRSVITRETTWHRPQQTVAQEPEPEDEEEDWADAEAGPAQGSTANPITADPLPVGWEEAWSYEEHRPYWRNAAGESTWSRPSQW